MGIESWSTTPGSNNASPPNGAPENMNPSAVNDTIRQQMADHRSRWQDAQWFNWGYTHTYASGTSFTIAGVDVTSTYSVGRRIRAVGSSTGTIYGTIASSSFSTNTTVTVTWDSGSLSNESLTISLGILTLTGGASVQTAPFTDSTTLVKGSSDATKLFRIEVDSFTTGNTRVMTPPDEDFTAVGLATTQTLTNKKLSDSTCTFADEGDATKQLAFQCSGISTATTRTVTIPDKSGTMAMLSDLSTLTLGTVQATTSGTTKTFSGLPTGIKQISIPFAGISTNGTTGVLVQLSTGTTFATTGYISTASRVATGGSTGVTTSTAGFHTGANSASATHSGTVTLTHMGSNLWAASWTMGDSGDSLSAQGGGFVTLGGELDGVRIITGNGTDAFDAGAVNIAYMV